MEHHHPPPAPQDVVQEVDNEDANLKSVAVRFDLHRMELNKVLISKFKIILKIL